MAEAEEAYEAGDMTEEEFAAAQEYYEEWRTTGRDPSTTGDGWGEAARQRKREKVEKAKDWIYKKTGLQFSVSEADADFQAEYEKNVDLVLKGTYTDSDPLILGRTPSVLERIGFAQLPVTITPGHVYSIAKTKVEAIAEGRYNKRNNYHGLGDAVVKGIMEKLSDPIAVVLAPDFDNKNAKQRYSAHRVIAIVELTVDNKQVIAPIEIDAEVYYNNDQIDSNLVASYYDRNNIGKIMTEVIAQENIGNTAIYYGNKKRIEDFVKTLGLQLPARFKHISDSDTIISNIGENVNRKIENVTQTQQFKRWFGDWQNDPANASKIVNADGTPKVMYHGSPAKFTVFDRKKARSGGLYGRGFYFTDSDAQAKVYGERYAVYLDVKYPLSPGNRAITEDQIRTFLEAVAENEDYSIENYGTYDVNEIIEGIESRDTFAVLQDINATAIGDLVEAVELFNEVNGTKYDGIVLPPETVVFKPTQIKSATENVGTFDGRNPDIRYSISRIDSYGEEITDNLTKYCECSRSLIFFVAGGAHGAFFFFAGPKQNPVRKKE